MQAARAPAAQRAFSALAAKIHPQLPLTPRESQQLLTLLTTTFRAHLDREHPINAPDNADKASAPSLSLTAPAPLTAPRPNPSHIASSHAASRHLDSILSNPLFAVKPRRRGSEPAAADVLRDPVTWFIDQIATGAATIPKAVVCLDVLEKTTAGATSNPHLGKTIVEWLRASGLDTSKAFIDACSRSNGFSGPQGSVFLTRLLLRLSAEGETSAPWRWFIRSSAQRTKETGLEPARISAFREQLLHRMVSVQTSASLDQGLATFMQAFRMTQLQGHDAAYAVLRPAGAYLVNHIIANPNHAANPELYSSFLVSSRQWLGGWGQAVEAMLWLHHPTEQSPLPGLQFIKDPSGAARYVKNAKSSRRRFLVQLNLEAARQLLQVEKHAEAQLVMEFTQKHFADIVLSKPSAPRQAPVRVSERKERENLEILDGLALT